MKKSKKLAAMVMALSLMAVTAAGYENEKPVRYFRCSKCGDTAWRYL